MFLMPSKKSELKYVLGTICESEGGLESFCGVETLYFLYLSIFSVGQLTKIPGNAASCIYMISPVTAPNRPAC